MTEKVASQENQLDCCACAAEDIGRIITFFIYFYNLSIVIYLKINFSTKRHNLEIYSIQNLAALITFYVIRTLDGKGRRYSGEKTKWPPRAINKDHY
jgi:hypothetical protein